jgi:hypothetical protein
MAPGTVFPTRHGGASWMRLILALLLALDALASLSPHSAWAKSITVINTHDNGAGSLRQAIIDAAAGDTITFNLPGNSPWTITLASSLPTINKALTIEGPGYNKLTIQGNNSFRLVTVNAPGKAVAISGLTLTKGKAVGLYGGNLRSIGGDLTLTSVALTNGTADDDQGGAGAYLSNGTFALSAVFITGNVAKGTIPLAAGPD